MRLLILNRRVMKRGGIAVAAMIFCLIVQSRVELAQRAQVPAASPHAAVVGEYCSGCHNDKLKSGGMTLTQLDLVRPERTAELAERVIRKLNTGLMPPAGARRPDGDALKQFAAYLASQIDKASAGRVNPGRRPFQHLTRTEYARSIHDLLGIDV